MSHPQPFVWSAKTPKPIRNSEATRRTSRRPRHLKVTLNWLQRGQGRIESSAPRLRRSLPYRFKAGETVPDNIRRIVAEEVDWAVGRLRAATPKTRDEAIHEARKSIKKLRGLLKLIRPELGNHYRAENKALRAIGRKLSELRDASAIIETFDGTVEKYPDHPQKHVLASIRKGLELD